MKDLEFLYEMPLETEDSYRVKMEVGQIIIPKSANNQWIPDIYFDCEEQTI